MHASTTFLAFTILLSLAPSLAGQDVVAARPPRRASADTPDVVMLRQPARVVASAFSADGMRLVLGCYRRTRPTVFDAATGDVICRLVGHDQEIRCAAWNAAGTMLATGSLDATICLWQPDGQLLRRIRGHERGVYSVAFSPDGRKLVSTGYDDQLFVFDVATGGQELRVPQRPRGVAFGADRQSLLVGGNNLRECSLADGATQREMSLPASHASSLVQVCAGAPWCAALIHNTSHHSQSKIALWNLATGKRQRLRGEQRARCLTFVRGGERLLAGLERELSVYDVASGALVHSSTVAPVASRLVALSRDGRRFAAVRAEPGGRMSVHVGAVPTWPRNVADERRERIR